jgi:sugar-specific transcriptional regulator TrmB
MEVRVNQVKFTLQNMGLNEYQASALAHLMYLGETKASNISKASGVPRARVYGVLEELSKKGLVIVRPGRPALYAPLSPEEIADSLIAASREELRRKLNVVESYKSDFEAVAEKVYMKAGSTEQRTSLIRIVSVGDVSIEETRKIYRGAEKTLLISTRAMEYLQQVKTELVEANDKGAVVKILMRDPETLENSDRIKQRKNIIFLRTILGDTLSLRFSDTVEIRGCVSDPDGGGKALFLVEEEGIPLFLREAAVTSHPGVVRALASMFDLKWRFDSSQKPIV